MAARSNQNVLDMVFYYNILPKERTLVSTIPFYNIYSYCIKFPETRAINEGEIQLESKFKVGDNVFVKPADSKCTTKWKNGVITKVNSYWSVDVDGIPRHISDIRDNFYEPDQESVPAHEYFINYFSDASDQEDRDEEDTDLPRRERKRPERFEDYVMNVDDLSDIDIREGCD